MSKPLKPSLASIVAASASSARGAPKPVQSAEIVQLDTGPPPERRQASTLKTRARQMSVYLEPPVYDQLRDLAHAERTKMHALMLEALDLLFRQRGTRSIAQLNDQDVR
ncbi:ribbon-helix-helix domain-containing protein [uncultured Methylobacterium sp.]|jgi:hypothetical protein|uniref:ribbon-helix-helix domain-containing protein n=1 Tax=uncultured Methylobacterium sp. TaxID=157278 RepID=UPI0035C967DB